MIYGDTLNAHFQKVTEEDAIIFGNPYKPTSFTSKIQ